MNCAEIKELISFYLDDEITPEGSKVLHEHLADCAECRSVLSSYEDIGAQIRLMPELSPSPDIRRRVLNDVSEKNQNKGWFFRVPFGARVAASAATVVFVAAGLLFVSQQGVLPPGTPTTTMVAQNTEAAYTIPADSVVRIRFDHPMDAQSVEQSVRVEPNVHVEMRWEDNTLAVVPKENLAPGTVYTITVDQSAKDTKGNTLSEPLKVALRAVEPNATGTPSGTATRSTGTIVSTGTPSDNSAEGQLVAQVTGTIKAEVLVDPVTTDAPVQVAEERPSITSTTEVASAMGSPASSNTAASGRTPAKTTPSTAAGGNRPAGAPTIASANPATATGEPGVGSDVTPTPARGETPTVTATVAPKTTVEVTEDLKTVYIKHAAKLAALGAPAAQGISFDVSLVRFQHGIMFQAAGSQLVYVVLADGTWVRYDSSLLSGAPAAGGSTETPQGTSLVEPQGVFGDIWREVGGVRDALGWAVETTTVSVSVAQDFEQGQLIDLGNGLVLALFDDGEALVVSGSIEDSSDTLIVPTATPEEPVSPAPSGTAEVAPAPTPSGIPAPTPSASSSPTIESTPIQ